MTWPKKYSSSVVVMVTVAAYLLHHRLSQSRTVFSFPCFVAPYNGKERLVIGIHALNSNLRA
jgi:hypothetical protein